MDHLPELQGTRYEVEVPIGERRFYRALRRMPDADGFRSSRHAGQKRAEDTAAYYGVSVYDLDWRALALARSLNASMPAKKPYLYVAEVIVRGPDGQACARTMPEWEGHYTIWGEPDELAKQVSGVWTLEGQKV